MSAAKKAYDFDGAIPGARAKGVFRYKIPVYREYLSVVLLP